MTSRSLSGAPPGGGKAIRDWPKRRQEDPKTVPRALHTIFQLPFSRPERPPEADLAPKTPQEVSRSPFGTPQDAKLDPRGVEFDPRGLLFWTRGRRFLQPPATHFRTQVGPCCAYNNIILCQLFLMSVPLSFGFCVLRAPSVVSSVSTCFSKAMK